MCSAYHLSVSQDLQHPNEFIRGSTLRFLCKLKEPELVEPLMPSIRQCLEHRHSYVRRNSVLAIYTIYRLAEAPKHWTGLSDLPFTFYFILFKYCKLIVFWIRSTLAFSLSLPSFISVLPFFVLYLNLDSSLIHGI